MALLQGIPVILYERVQVGTDAFNAPLYEETPVTVMNVLVCPTSSDEIVGENQPQGKRAVYELLIPKENTNVWENRVVEFFGHRWKTIGIPMQWLDGLVPGAWNRKVKVARYG